MWVSAANVEMIPYLGNLVRYTVVEAGGHPQNYSKIPAPGECYTKAKRAKPPSA